MCILMYPACQPREIMSDHNQYCNTNNMFKEVENDETTTIDNDNFKESDELLIDTVRAYPHLYNHRDRFRQFDERKFMERDILGSELIR